MVGLPRRSVCCHTGACPAGWVGSCMGRWKLSWCGPDGGPTGVLGKGLAGAPARVIVLLVCVSVLECLQKDLHATTGISPESLPHGGSGLKVDSLRRRGASC